MARPIEPTGARDLRALRDDLNATLAARRDLGPVREMTPAMEDALVTNFLSEIERAIDARVDARLSDVGRGRLRRAGARTGTVAASLALSIPLLAIAGGIAHLAGIALVLAMVILVNLIDFAKS